MVQEMINAVKDAEKKAAEMVEAAEKDSVSLIRETENKAKELKKKAKSEMQIKGDELLADKVKEYEADEGRVAKEMDEEIKSIIDDAKTKEENAIEEVLKNLY